MTTSCSMPATERGPALLAWYARHARDLPWRRRHDAYAIWISEIMLQQTQVRTVVPRYTAWLARFPDTAALARAESAEVMKAWEGLGYYRRARMLHEAARIIVRDHAGVFPSAFADILALPGIGRSTAGAIASFCFAARTPVLDGNVKRVIRRWHDTGVPDGELWALAQQAIDDAPDAAAWNQAMMELGATHCGPRKAECAACPVSTACASAFRAQIIPGKAIPVRDVHWRVELHTCPERGLWLTQRPSTGIWAGLWAPPIRELTAAPDETPAHVHALTHRRLHLYAAAPDTEPAGDGRWFSSLDEAALPTGIRRLLATQGMPA